jgi:UDP-2-acetamido-2-deoxy-ribo-hexuluronate aminotransferase
VQERLKVFGIPTAVHYPIPLNKQAAVAASGAQLQVSDDVAQRVISLPMGPYLSWKVQSLIVDALFQTLVQ